MRRAISAIALLIVGPLFAGEPSTGSKLLQQSGDIEIAIVLFHKVPPQIKPGVKVDVEAAFWVVRGGVLSAPELPKSVRIKSIGSDRKSAILIVSKRDAKKLRDEKPRCAFYLVLHDSR